MGKQFRLWVNEDTWPIGVCLLVILTGEEWREGSRYLPINNALRFELFQDERESKVLVFGSSETFLVKLYCTVYSS